MTEENSQNTQQGPGAATLSPDVLASFQNLLGRAQNDAVALAQQLFTENHNLREDRRKLKEELAGLKTKLPDGSVVVTQADADLLEQYRKLGTPKDLQTTISDAQKARRDAVVSKAAQALQYKSSVLSRLLPEGAVIEFRAETHDGVQVEIPVLKVGDQARDLKTAVEADYADFIPALSEGQNQDGKSQQPTQYVRQPAGGKAPGSTQTDPVAARLEANQKRATAGNPLIKKE